MTKKVELKFEETLVERALRLAIRKEVERQYKAKDKELTRQVLGKLVHDCRLEVIPSRRMSNVISSKKNKNEK